MVACNVLWNNVVFAGTLGHTSGNRLPRIVPLRVSAIDTQFDRLILFASHPRGGSERNMIVVIPSNRAVNLDFLRPLIDSGARFVVVDDSEGTIQLNHPQFRVFTWKDRRRMLGALDVAIPRSNGACRDLGFLIAWHEMDNHEIVVALDDDCVVEDPHFPEEVARVLETGPSVTLEAATPFFNVLDVYEGIDTPMFPRGFPYSARAGYQRPRFVPAQPRPAKFHLGLWQGDFDINAIDKLHLRQWAFPEARLKVASVGVPAGTWVSACSMNMQFRREVIPAVYQLPMRIEVLPPWCIDRYGDIWGGFILKALMDVRGDQLSVGGPMIRHLKEGSFEKNMRQEHLAHLVNDEFIGLLRAAAADLQPADYLAMMEHLAEGIAARVEHCSPILKSYIEHLLPALRAWLSVLRMRPAW